MSAENIFRMLNRRERVKVSEGKGHQDQGRREGAKEKGRSLLDRDPSILVHLQLQLCISGETGRRVMPWERTPAPPIPPRQAWGSRFAQEGVPGGILSQDVHSQLEQLLSPDLRGQDAGEGEWGPEGLAQPQPKPKPRTRCGTPQMLKYCFVRGRQELGAENSLVHNRPSLSDGRSSKGQGGSPG